VLHSVVPATAARTLSVTSAEESDRILAEHNVAILPAARKPLPAARRRDAVDAELEALTQPIPVLPPASRRPDDIDRELEALTAPITLPRRD
jgi:hypothetical protein